MMGKSYMAALPALVLLVAGCNKSFDVPPFQPVTASAAISLKQLKSRLGNTNGYYRFGQGDTNLFCTVTADESSGNFYRQIYVRDDEGTAIQVRLVSEGGLFTGDRIRINLNGLYAVTANSMMYLDSVSLEKNVVKLSSGNSVLPKVTSIAGILSLAGSPADAGSLQSQLVELNGVEFISSDRGKPFADAVSKNSLEYTVTDCNGKTISIRTSGRSNFAQKPTPAANGKLIAIVSQYNTEMQLSIRNYGDVQMSAPCCTQVSTVTSTFTLAAPVSRIAETFSNVTLNYTFDQPGWINYGESGSAKWKGSVKSGTYKALRASSYATGETNVIWLISPPVVYRSGMNLSFKSGCEYWVPGHPNALMCYVSTNFTGANLNTANWTPVSALYPGMSDINYTGAAGLKSSGIISLQSMDLLKTYTGNFFVAFKYSGDPVYTSNIYLDDIIVE